LRRAIFGRCNLSISTLGFDFEEGALSVEVEGRFAGQAYGLTYEGAPRGDALQGSVRWSFGWASGSFPFDGERVEQQVASSR
jgi:hypothetical protein